MVDGLELAEPFRRLGAKTTTMKATDSLPCIMREKRRRLRLRQLDLARRVGCTESLISKIETGRSTPDHWLKEAIATELGIRTWEVGQ